MNASLKDTLEKAKTWPAWAQEELATLAGQIDPEVQGGTYHATREELRILDEASAAVERGEIATDAEVEAVFAKHRRT